MGKFIKISIFILLVSVLLFNFIDFNKHDEITLRCTVKLIEFLLDIDSFLRYFHINGFFRSLESGFGKISFYLTDKTKLIIERKVFDGVNVILFSPIKHDKHRPAIIYFHGGGWSLYNPDIWSPFLANLSRNLNMMIVAVDYRKAPEYPYPAGFNDAIAATKYIFINSARFDVDPNRIGLMGDSAGGNLAVAVGYHLAALKKANKNIWLPKILIPLNPVLQFADMSIPSYRDNTNDPLLTKTKMTKFFCIYAFGKLSGSELEMCSSGMMTNSHLNTETIEKVKSNVDWKSYLFGKGYDNRPKSSFTHKPNQFTKRLSQLAIDPGFSPLSALNDTQLQILPPVFAFGSSKDPLRDDAKILVARMKKQKPFGDYLEFECTHCCFLLSGRIGTDKIEKAMKLLIGLFEKNAIL